MMNNIIHTTVNKNPLFSDVFRPVFILLPIYIAVSIFLWGLVWSGQVPLFIKNPLAWHIYEMMFGVASAGIIGFALTFIPEFYPDVKPISKMNVFYITVLWIIGRITFWMMDIVGVYFVAFTNLPLLIWVSIIIAKPIIFDPLHHNISLGLTFVGIAIIQFWFFASIAGWVNVDYMSILKVSLGAFMVLELLVLRRITTGTINELLKKYNIDDIFIARPPRYNIAILCIILFTVCEFFSPDNPILAWLGIATAAAILNTLNDFFIDSEIIIFKPYVFPLFLILVFMAVGYGLMGVDYLYDGLYGINHFRHFLTTGVFGLSFFMVMVIVGTIHTGRDLVSDKWLNVGITLIIAATLLRSLMPFFSDQIMTSYTSWLYMGSAILWAMAFIIYTIFFYSTLSQKAK